MQVWRLGYKDAPVNFVPREHCKWEHRFDDVNKSYRTLYCAESAITCLREVLADYRPNTKLLADFAEVFSPQEEGDLTVAGIVSTDWRMNRVLVEAEIEISTGELVDIDSVPVREELTRSHARMLQEHGIQHLNISEIRSKDRIVTRTFSRYLYDKGAAGIRFRSNLDDRQVFALFEERARLRPVGPQIPMAQDVPELIRVCGEYALVLRPI